MQTPVEAPRLRSSAPKLGCPLVYEIAVLRSAIEPESPCIARWILNTGPPGMSLKFSLLETEIASLICGIT